MNSSCGKSSDLLSFLMLKEQTQDLYNFGEQRRRSLGRYMVVKYGSKNCTIFLFNDETLNFNRILNKKIYKHLI